MIKDINGISITGKCFTQKTDLILFKKPNHRISVIFGRNGSGKTTISRAFANIKTQEFNEIEAKLLYNNQSAQNIPEEDIFVFNEDFIDKNIRINQDNLSSIVLFGAQINIQNEIDRLNNILNVKNEKLEEINAHIYAYNDPRNPFSCISEKEKIKQILSERWAGTQSKIRNLKIKSPINDNVINIILSTDIHLSKQELTKKLDDALKILDKASDSEVIVTTQLYKIEASNFPDEERICKLLSKKINAPELSEREKKILEAMQTGKQTLLENLKNEIVENDITYCPYCFQKLERKYKEELKNNIEHILNQETDNHRIELQNNVFPSLNYDFDKYKAIDVNLVNNIALKKVEIDNIIKEYEQNIKNKIENIYKPINIKILGLENKITDINNLIDHLNQKIKIIQQAKLKFKEQKEYAESLNNQLAKIEISPAYDEYIKSINAARDLEKNQEAINSEMNSLRDEIVKLEQEKQNTTLAIDKINKNLEYIFFNKNYISIEPSRSGYKIKSKSRDVKPTDISIGERNALALCYFFTKILENKDTDKFYKNDQLIVLDDPVSSFDFENKVGIFSFLRSELDKILNANHNSKIVLLTHDLITYKDLTKLAEDVLNKKDIYTLTLENLNLKEYDNKKGNEYKELLKKIYDYGNNKTNSSIEISIGNCMRRVLEAFSTFIYSKGMDKISREEIIKNSLKEFAPYFSNLMYRLVLNSESHLQNRSESIDTLDFSEFISENEKRRTARDILVFLYILQKDHIKSYIPESIEKIEEWKLEIQNKCVHSDIK